MDAMHSRLHAPGTLRTARLLMVPATAPLLRAELSGADALAAQTGARVPAEWPPELYDEAAMRWSLEWLIAHPEGAGWSFYYLVLPEPDRVPDRVLIGIAGFKGLPDADGTVEIGYSIVAPHRRRGLASEAVRALVDFAFEDARVIRIVAETLPELAPSIGVLEKCGFTYDGPGSEDGVIRFARARTADATRA